MKTIEVLRSLNPPTSLVKDFPAEVSAVEGAIRTHRFTITTGDPDRERDVISPDGWKLDAYLKNPVVLWAHDYRTPPVAVARTMERVAGGLSSVAEFVDPAVYPFAGTVEALVRMLALRAASVGFRPLVWNFNEERRGVDFAEQELLEYSIVPVPANPQCLVEARAAGVDVEPLREWAARTLERLSEPGDLGLPRSYADKLARFVVRTGDVERSYFFAPVIAVAAAGGANDVAPAVPLDPTREAAAAAPAAPAPVDATPGRAVSEACPMGEECPMKAPGDSCQKDDCPMKAAAGVQKSYGGYETSGHTDAAKGQTAPEHVHDYALWVYVDSRGVTHFDGGRAYDVADHSHRITEASLVAGSTEESDGHAHKLMRAAPPRAAEESLRLGEVVLEDEIIDLDAVFVEEDELAGLTAADIAAAVREAISAEVDDAVHRAVGAARGRVD